MATELTDSALEQHPLEYVSLEIDGKTYGGWYRLLEDGRMELLALATMHSEQRAEGTPLEQAKGMLTDFIRSSTQRRAGVLIAHGARH
ncbi:hypothetical protein [Steroidobacter sp.]|uniref:hypothetical protein n=1 Tax=Steroidobacter sp. TaxID=1978227 RepID=UPI001A5E064E|nr:hypothetical protein [Steroidobacter sp.]MBL8266272.1 hypothetical protein [Steroidobacter sp.]